MSEQWIDTSERKAQRKASKWKAVGVIAIVAFVVVPVGTSIARSSAADARGDRLVRDTLASVEDYAAQTPADELPTTEDEVDALAFDLVWKNVTPSEKATICEGFADDPQTVVDGIQQGAGGPTSPFSDADVWAFFDRVC
jgi:hypothetical protein